MAARPFTPADRLRALPNQFFAGLVAATEARIRAGHDVINLGQGNPVDPTPPHIVQALQDAAADPRYHRYISFRGLHRLKEQAARWWEDRHGVVLDPDREIAILIGVKVGLAEVALATLNPGDVAAVPDPGYPDYWSGIALAGARRISLRLPAARGFRPAWEELPATVRLVFLNYPHNPTGQVGEPALFAEAVEFARRTGAVIAHDLAYGDILYDGHAAPSFLATPGAREVGVEFVSLSKSYNMAGWRIGLVAGHPDIIGAIELLQDHLHCSQFGAVQEAAIAALTSPPEVTESVRARYRERREAFLGPVREAGWDIPPIPGGIFLWGAVPGEGDGEAFSRFLLETADVMVAPGIGFGAEGRRFVRISLTAPTDRIGDAARRIARVLPEWNPAADSGASS
jgi:aminotransferase